MYLLLGLGTGLLTGEPPPPRKRSLGYVENRDKERGGRKCKPFLSGRGSF